MYEEGQPGTFFFWTGQVGQAFQPDYETCQAGKPDLLPCRGSTDAHANFRTIAIAPGIDHDSRLPGGLFGFPAPGPACPWSGWLQGSCLPRVARSPRLDCLGRLSSASLPGT